MLFAVLLLACTGDPKGGDPDGDGVPRDADCNEGDPDVFPGAPEFCRDGVVNDCEDTEADARAFCALWREVTAEEASAMLRGESRGDQAGASVAGAGDVTGDGVPDVLVGAPGREDGAVFVVSGAMRGREDVGVAEAVLVGEAAAPGAGTAVAGGGDVDGDGIPDVVVTAPGDGAADEARIYVASGPFSGELDLGDAVRWRAEQGIGATLGVGDVDGDGAVDLVLGAPTYEDGAVYVVTGPLDADGTVDEQAPWLTGDARDAVGAAIAVGDLDGDGVADLAAGVPTAGDDTGAVVILYGPPGDAVAAVDADVVLPGTELGAEAGTSVASGGDVDGDGIVDLLVGAKELDAKGGAYVVTGAGAGTLGEVATARLLGERSSDEAGAAVAILGDVDADGFADLGVGAPQVGNASGALYVVYGPVLGDFELRDSDILVRTAYDQDELGRSMAGAGDLDGDGRGDFVVGSALHSENGDNAGVAWIFLAAPI